VLKTANHVSSVEPVKRAMRAKWCGQLEEIAGFVFPVRSKDAKSIFEEGKEVFVKFGGRLKKLQAGAKAI